jgi:hypothetical protein
MSPDRRHILEQVASGELTPAEAEELLRDQETQAADDLSDLDIRRVKVSAGVGAIEVIGDTGVAQAEIDGPHQAEVEGDTLVVRADIDPNRRGAFAIAIGRRGKMLRVGHPDSPGGHPVSRLRIRMNPQLELETHLDAGPLSITGMKGSIRARVAAGPLTIEDFTGTLDIAVNAGAIRASGKLVAGESRVRSDAGAVRIELDPSSSVRIIAQAALGKVVVPGYERERKRGFGGDRQEAVIGNGDATLRVETAMGSVHVSSR